MAVSYNYEIKENRKNSKPSYITMYHVKKIFNKVNSEKYIEIKR